MKETFYSQCREFGIRIKSEIIKGNTICETWVVRDCKVDVYMDENHKIDAIIIS